MPGSALHREENDAQGVLGERGNATTKSAGYERSIGTQKDDIGHPEVGRRYLP